MTHDQFFMPSVKNDQKRSCLNFKLDGELSRFNKFDGLVCEISHFLKERKLYSTPLFRGETSHGISLEFHQDAVLEGKLVGSINPESESLTHPSFFKNLTTSCEPLSSFSKFNYSKKKRIQQSSIHHYSESMDFIEKMNNAFQLFLLLIFQIVKM